MNALSQVRQVDENALKWIMENEPSQWSRYAFDTEAESDHMTNNMSETFHSCLGEDRELPILNLLELFRRRIIRRLQSKYKVGVSG